MNHEKVIGIILTYNSARLLETAYQKIPREEFDKIIVIDDGSTDKTLEIAQQLGIEHYTHEHSGYGGNIKFALRKAVELGGTYIVELHGDGQFDPSSTSLTISKLKRGCDLILGNRFTQLTQPLKDGMSLIRYFGNLSLSLLGRIVLMIKPADLFTGFRAYSADLVKVLDLESGSNDYFFSFEIIAQSKFVGGKICDVPVRCYYNQDHTSMNIMKGVLEIFQTPYVLGLYILAKLGIRLKIFSNLKSSSRIPRMPREGGV